VVFGKYGEHMAPAMTYVNLLLIPFPASSVYDKASNNAKKLTRAELRETIAFNAGN
jgi:hypothetical protein